MHSSSPLVLLVLVAAAGQAAAQMLDPTGKLHPYLRAEIRQAGQGAKLPVYFVLRDRFPFDRWYPRLLRLEVGERRRIAVRELRAHAARTQKELLAELRAAERRGLVADIRVNWAGNFVLCRASAAAIAEAATLASVGEVWYDADPPPAQVEDAAPAGPLVAGPGNGPVQVNAPAVWAMGFKGKGVVVMNADSGLTMSGTQFVNHTALRNRVWRNPGETFNGRDDDNNGKVDDVYGWDFRSNNNTIDDRGGHGTNTAGVMVADGSCNNTIYGVAPEAKLMTGQLAGESTQWQAVQYAIAEGADAQTSSHSYKIWFRPPPNYAMHRDVANASLLAGLIRTNSTSNDGSSCSSSTRLQRPPFNISAPGNLPPPYLDPNQKLAGGRSGVIGVGAWFASSNSLPSFSPCGPFAWSLAELRARVSYPHAWRSPLYDDYPTTFGRMGLLKPDVVAPTSTLTTAGSGCGIRTFGGTSNATPNCMGCILLWKSANRSLKPEDVAMILHQTSRDRGSVPGKENRWGAGVVDALAGVERALSVHRVDGDPAWTVKHKAGTKITFELDGSESKLGLILAGASRRTTKLGFVTLGLGQPLVFLAAGSTGTSGDKVRLSFMVPASVAGATVFSQGFLDDTTGPTKRWLSSNVIGTTITP